eukprot:jgi/Botrbrau1/7150/Bobra.0143s0023.1
MARAPYRYQHEAYEGTMYRLACVGATPDAICLPARYILGDCSSGHRTALANLQEGEAVCLTIHKPH